MMICSSFLGAVLITGAYYGAIYRADKKWDMPGYRIRGLPVARSILITGICSFLAMFWLGTVAFWNMPLSMVMMQYVLIWGMSVLAVIDHQKQVIPNRVLLFLILVWTAIVGITVIISTAYGMALFFQSLAGAFTGGMIFLLCYFFSGRQLGAGDVKLAFVMGLYLTGQRVIGAVFYGIILCLIYSVIQLVRRKIGLKDGVALVPFLYIGVLITLLTAF